MKKQQKIDEAIAKLKEKEIDYQVKNNGIHLQLVTMGSNKVDFYPTTGNWRSNNGNNGIGLNNVIRFCVNN